MDRSPKKKALISTKNPTEADLKEDASEQQKNPEELSEIEKLEAFGILDLPPHPIVQNLERQAKIILRQELEQRRQQRMFFEAHIVQPYFEQFHMFSKGDLDLVALFWNLRVIFETNLRFLIDTPADMVHDFANKVNALLLPRNLNSYFSELIQDYYLHFQENFWRYHTVINNCVVMNLAPNFSL